MVPPAPVTFSITTGCPSDCPMRSPTTRAITSVAPPAANGTIMVTGRDGKDCAAALPANPDIAAMAVIPQTTPHTPPFHPLYRALPPIPPSPLAHPKPPLAPAP